MPLELVPLCTARVSLAPPIVLPGTPVGTRIIGEVTAVDVDGPRIKAHMKGAAAADWLILGPDGTLGTVDVRVTWETDDGAVIFAHDGGRLVLAPAPPVAYVTPRFDTGDERYGWLARIQAVAKGTFSDDMSVLTYEMFELR
ncbi:MAG: hypothetical protein QOG64_155 [Acidimicrobiaceae bacterium]|jgi:hypothetical protein|nr:hypothetical protein [Acidimicrobiaceae bacterium]